MHNKPFFLVVAEDDQAFMPLMIKQHYPQWHYYFTTNGKELLTYLDDTIKFTTCFSYSA
ncbi:hypothetical protein [Xanthocytophaga flava]|uniref:hypothetical protein n=1 Tax=Xanthocytophaga flava TaxID=3048013 RepID=UPI0028D2C83B|nr:hypothetical protein [Xanthocytophaga flavus]MDJ1473818.1 hypothetical protein [Xanthocytophaga flavus]